MTMWRMMIRFRGYVITWLVETDTREQALRRYLNDARAKGRLEVMRRVEADPEHTITIYPEQEMPEDEQRAMTQTHCLDLFDDFREGRTAGEQAEQERRNHAIADSIARDLMEGKYNPDERIERARKRREAQLRDDPGQFRTMPELREALETKRAIVIPHDADILDEKRKAGIDPDANED